MAAGRFTFGGETRELGLEPDWLGADLPEDEEWRIDWVKFYYGLDLADAYRSTGDARYLRAWERLVASFVLAGPARPRRQRGHRAPDPQLDLRLAAAAGGWTLRRARARREPRASRSRHVRANLSPERNHRTLELYALLIASLALRARRPADASRSCTRTCWRTSAPDGVHRERSTHYHCIALRSFVGARENCRRFGVELPRGFDERLALACEFARDCRRPDGTIPALSDSDTGDYTRAAARSPRGCSPARTCWTSRGRRLSRRRLLRPARRRPLPDLRLRPVGGRRPRALRRAEPRGVGGRPAAGGRPRPLLVRRGRPELAPLVPRHRGAQHRDRRRRRPDAVRALALVAAERRRDVPRPRRATPSPARSASPCLRRRAPPRGDRSSTAATG